MLGVDFWKEVSILEVARKLPDPVLKAIHLEDRTPSPTLTPSPNPKLNPRADPKPQPKLHPQLLPGVPSGKADYQGCALERQTTRVAPWKGRLPGSRLGKADYQGCALERQTTRGAWSLWAGHEGTLGPGGGVLKGGCAGPGRCAGLPALGGRGGREGTFARRAGGVPAGGLRADGEEGGGGGGAFPDG